MSSLISHPSVCGNVLRNRKRREISHLHFSLHAEGCEISELGAQNPRKPSPTNDLRCVDDSANAAISPRSHANSSNGFSETNSYVLPLKHKVRGVLHPFQKLHWSPWTPKHGGTNHCHFRPRFCAFCSSATGSTRRSFSTGDFVDFSRAYTFCRDTEFIIQNAVFDLGVLKRALGIEIPAERIFDTFVASSILTNTAFSKEQRSRRRRDYHPNSLESILARVLYVNLNKEHQSADWSVNLSLPEHEPMREYAANDVRYLHWARLELRAQLEAARLWKIYELERDLVPCVAAMNESGVPADLNALRRLHEQALELTAREEAKVLRILGRTINIRSRKCQLLPLLQEMGITYQGAPLATTDKKILPLVDQAEHPIIQALLDWSSANEEQKQLKQWLGKTDPSNGQSYPQANQFGTVTHRFSYRAPNLQQVKKNDIRRIIIAPTGHLILRADFETLELVIAAVYHKEEKVLEAIRRGVDLHALTASQIFRLSIEQVIEKQRDLGKLTNLSRIYGTGLEGFIHRCHLDGVTLSQEELEAAYYAFDDVWPNLASYRAHTAKLVAMGRHPREIHSMYGRRILLDASLSLRELRGAFLNYPIQASASDLLKLTMRRLWQEGASILASVHDEILLAVKPSRLKQSKRLFQEAAAEAGRLVLGSDVPVRLEIGAGKSWWEASLDAKKNRK